MLFFKVKFAVGIWFLSKITNMIVCSKELFFFYFSLNVYTKQASFSSKRYTELKKKKSTLQEHTIATLLLLCFYYLRCYFSLSSYFSRALTSYCSPSSLIIHNYAFSVFWTLMKTLLGWEGREAVGCGSGPLSLWTCTLLMSYYKRVWCFCPTKLLT